MDWLIQTTIYGSITACILLLIKHLFRNKMSAKWQYYIWAILLVRLLMPVLPESSISVFNVLPKTDYVTQAPQRHALSERSDAPLPNLSVNESITETGGAEAPVASTVTRRSPLLLFWGIGGIGLLLYFLAVHLTFVLKTKRRGKEPEEGIRQILKECRNKTDTKRKVRVLIGGDTPMLMGWLNPCILLPQGYSPSETRDIFLHELCHLKYGDIAALWCATFLLCANWFNPLMWFCFFRLRKDIELACDQRVLELTESKKAYAGLLLKTALRRNRFIAGTTSIQNGEKQVEKRIKQIAFYKKPKFYWSAIIILVVLVIGGVCLTNAMNGANAKTQVLDISGYTVNIPADWEIRQDDADRSTVALYVDGTLAGKATLAKDEIAVDDLPGLFGLSADVLDPKGSDKFAAPAVELSYRSGVEPELTTEDQQELDELQKHYGAGSKEYIDARLKKLSAAAVKLEEKKDVKQYTFTDLPNPPPYAYTIWFDKDVVSQGKINKILKSFTLPNVGKNPPPKNVAEPAAQDIEQNAMYTIADNGAVSAFNTFKLERFMQNMQNKTADSLDILQYANEDGDYRIQTWSHLAFDGSEALMYSYYRTQDGNYTYDNNPVAFSHIVKTDSPENGVTSYHLALGASDAEVAKLIEIPYNLYAANEEGLLSRKNTLVGNNAEVGAIIDSIPVAGATRDTFSLQTDKEPYGISIAYNVDNADLLYKDGKLDAQPFRKNATVMFSLIDNVDKIEVTVKNGDKTDTLTFERDEMQQYFPEDVREYAKETPKFSEFVEDVQNLPEPTPKPTQKSASGSSGGSASGNEVVTFQTSVTAPASGSMVTHPRTGNKVVIDPYAEKYGVSQYLGKTITITVYEGGTADNPKIRAVATCGGSVVYSTTFATQAEKRSFISMVQSYGG